MAKTFEDIHYGLRPGKNVERKMMVEVIKNLSHIYPLKDYQYIGFGSTYFTDFRLFHRRLGIENMISIEKVSQAEDRVRFNKPFDCIRLEFGRSDDKLPNVPWDHPTILWLDYEGKLQSYMFDDIEQFAAFAPPGSMLFVTVNAKPTPRKHLGGERDRLDELREQIGENNIPRGTSKNDLRKWGLSDVYRNIILRKINEEMLPPRNMEEESELEFRQLVNYRYNDGAKMMTVGGILYTPEISEGFDAAFPDTAEDTNPELQKNDEYYEIKTPKLTFEEMNQLDKSLPTDPLENEVPVPETAKEDYADIYRYYPKYSELVQ